jgi:hypothetical protein
MNPNYVFIFANQGSKKLHDYYDSIAEKLGAEKTVVVKGKVLTSLVVVLFSDFRFWGCLSYFKRFLTFYRSAKLQLESDIKTKRMIADGVERIFTFRFLARFSRNLSDWLYFSIWILNAFHLKEILVGKGQCIIIAPDEVYGFAAVVKFNSTVTNTWIINSNASDLHCNILNYDSPQKYKYSCRSNCIPLSSILDDALNERVDQRFLSVFDNTVVHRDYSLAYHREKSRFVPDALKGRLKILVAAHIFCDAPNAHQTGFSGFRHWLYESLSVLSLHEDQIEIYVKEHPSIALYREQGVLNDVIKSFALSLPIKIIDAQYVTQLRDFDLILTCNGSICYEAAYLGVPVISCSEGFAANLKNVVSALTSEALRQAVAQFFSGNILQRDGCVLDDYQYSILVQWIILRNVSNFGGSSDLDLECLASSFVASFNKYALTRNSPGITRLSQDLSAVEIVKCPN